MAKYRIVNPTDEKFNDLARICFNLRLYSKIWKEHFGAKNRNNMVTWEEKLDKFLEDNIELDISSDFEADLSLEKEKWTVGYRDW